MNLGSPVDAPVNNGHAHAVEADRYERQHLWMEAMEEHRQAEEQFRRARDDTSDPENRNTLDLLVKDHARKIKELAWKYRLAQKNARLDALAGQGRSGPSHASASIGSSRMNMSGLRHDLPGVARAHDSGSQIGESYAVLSPNDDEDDDASDPFNKFLQVVETLVDKLSNPVAFASAPLNENDNPAPTVWKHHGDEREERSDMAESYFMVPDQSALKQTLNTADRGHDDDANGTRDWKDYRNENEHLKKTVEQLTKRIRYLEKSAEEGNMLKSSIVQFRHDVQRAKRIMKSHDSSMRSSAAALYASSNGIRPQASAAEMASRLKDVEEENKQLKHQNEKQEQMMNKYRERWEKLKESAKKRRADHALTHTPSVSDKKQTDI